MLFGKGDESSSDSEDENENQLVFAADGSVATDQPMMGAD